MVDAPSIFLACFKSLYLSHQIELARFYNDLHTDIIWPTIIAFTLIHIGAALYHQFVKKDNLIARIK
ncbi:cytochrome b/b6 domain-containing protein [Psychrobacter sp. JCM 18903]|uniref:cytochrome b/b6 domain-containing protein n=1 Tax=Psychrobacter sp. JCM 18903 TaxID=1298610 RepID=UPI0033653B4B